MLIPTSPTPTDHTKGKILQFRQLILMGVKKMLIPTAHTIMRRTFVIDARRLERGFTPLQCKERCFSHTLWLICYPNSDNLGCSKVHPRGSY